jgi:DNA-binding NarL/FixJ family response regulator
MDCQTIRVVIADDHLSAREGIRILLQAVPDIVVVGEAQDGVEAQQRVAELRPDILLLDLVMPGPRPMDIERWVREHIPETTVLILTAHDRDHFLAQAVEAGVGGYLTKDIAQADFVAAIHRAARGEVLLTVEQLARARRWSREIGVRWESLTKREREVLEILARGKSNTEIAEALSIEVRTVEMHLTNAMGKLGVASRLEAAVWIRDNLPDDTWKPTG